jgi:hypothetical protein
MKIDRWFSRTRSRLVIVVSGCRWVCACSVADSKWKVSRWQGRVRTREGNRSREAQAWGPYREESRNPGSILVRSHFSACRSASVESGESGCVVHAGTNTRHWSNATRATTSSHDNCCATESEDGRRSRGAPFMFSKSTRQRTSKG